jgi:hypothetical protein
MIYGFDFGIVSIENCFKTLEELMEFENVIGNEVYNRNLCLY